MVTPFSDWLREASSLLTSDLPFYRERLMALPKLQDEVFIAKQKEYYQYIPFGEILQRLVAQPYQLSDPSGLYAYQSLVQDGPTCGPVLTFINGLCAPQHTSLDPRFVQVRRFADLPNLDQIEMVHQYREALCCHEDFFVTLSMLLAQESYLIEIAADIPSTYVFTIQQMVTESAGHVVPHLLFKVGQASQVVIKEHWQAAAATHFINNLTYVDLSKGASLTHYTFYSEQTSCYQIHTLYVVGKAHSHFAHYTFALGSTMVRLNLMVQLAGKDATATLQGLSALAAAEKIDYRIQVTHSCPSGVSKQHYRAILGQEAMHAFYGKIYLTAAAQQTHAYQSNHAILLSRNARHYVQPQLEIYADHVKCSHGASVGQLDQEQQFYLQSRGIAADFAQRLLLEAFGSTLVDAIADSALQKSIAAAFIAKLVKL